MTSPDTEKGNTDMEQSFDDRVAEKRAEMLDKMAPMAERRMNDTRYNALRKPGIRKTLSAILLLLCVAIAFTHEPAGLALANMILIFALWFLLGRINRGFIDLPEELVDERIKERRNESYRWSYLIASGAALAIIPTSIIQDAAGETMSGLHPVGSFFALVWLFIVLPTIVFTWREKEL